MAYERMNLQDGDTVEAYHATHIEDELETLDNETEELSNSLADLTLTNDMIPQLAVDFDDPPDYPIFRANSSSTNTPSTSPNQWMVLYFKTTNSSYQTMLAFSWSGSLYRRSKVGSSTWGDWSSI